MYTSTVLPRATKQIHTRAQYLIRETVLIHADLAGGESDEEIKQRVVEAHGVLLQLLHQEALRVRYQVVEQLRNESDLHTQWFIRYQFPDGDCTQGGETL